MMSIISPIKNNYLLVTKTSVCNYCVSIMSVPCSTARERMYSLCPIFFVLFEKSNFLREHHLLSCLPFKNV